MFMPYADAPALDHATRDIDAAVIAGASSSVVYEVATQSPLDTAPLLSARLGVHVLLKREDRQPVFSFKLRGAYQRMRRLSSAERVRGVIAASAGNHAQGVALAATRLGVSAVIVMPTSAPQVKVDAVRRLGSACVEVVLSGESFTEAQAEASRLQADRALTFVHPFDDVDVIAGQASIGRELLHQAPPDLAAVFVPVGGGGLLAGVATWIKTHRPDIQVFGVQTTDSDAMTRSLEAGRRITLPRVGLFADGTAVKRVGRLTFRQCRRHVDGMLRVDTRAVCAAMRDVYQDTRCVPEPSGALALAGLKQHAAAHCGTHGSWAAVISGANMNFERLGYVLEHAEIAAA